MAKRLKLSELVNEINDAIQKQIAGDTFWITAKITDVKKQTDKRWYFFKFIKKEGHLITAEIKGVFWANTFHNVEKLRNYQDNHLPMDWI